MVTAPIFRKLFRLSLFLVLSTLLLLPSPVAPVALAQGAPAACRNDAGNPVRPGAAGWTLVLNFNHAPSVTSTMGCVVQASKSNPPQITYDAITCQVINNVNSVPVGGGSASFDGNLWLECSNGFGHGKTLHEFFYIGARATFLAPNASYTILHHQDVDAQVVKFVVDVDTTWQPTLKSRYGSRSNGFDNTVSGVNVSGQINHYESHLVTTTGRHEFDGADLPDATVTPFDYDYNKPLTISGPGQIWVLYELIVDPPGKCCDAQ